MAPGEGEVPAGAGHFKAGVKNGVEDPENPEALDSDILDEGIDERRHDTVGTEEGYQKYHAQEDDGRRCGLHVHDVENPVVVDAVVDHARPEGGKDDGTATISVQCQKPGNQQQKGGWP